MRAVVTVDVSAARAGAREAIFVDAPASPLNPGDALALAADIEAACSAVDALCPPQALPPVDRVWVITDEYRKEPTP